MAVINNITDPGPVLATCSARYGMFTIFFALGQDGKMRFIRQKDDFFAMQFGTWQDWEEIGLPQELEDLPAQGNEYFGTWPGFTAAQEGNAVRLWVQPYTGLNISGSNFATYTLLISDLTTSPTWGKWEESSMGTRNGNYSQYAVASPTVGGQFFFCGISQQLATGYRATPTDKWQSIRWFESNLGLSTNYCQFSVAVNFGSYFVTYFVDPVYNTLFYVYNDTLTAKGPGTGWKSSGWADIKAFRITSLAAAQCDGGSIQIWATDTSGNIWTANHKDPSSAIGTWTKCDLGGYEIRSSFQSSGAHTVGAYTTPQINACYNEFHSAAVVTAITPEGILLYATMDSKGTMSAFQPEFQVPSEIKPLYKYMGDLANRQPGGKTQNLWGEFTANHKVTVRSGPNQSQAFTMPVGTKTWMTELWDIIKGMPLNGIALPGTHDTLTSSGANGYGIDKIVFPVKHSLVGGALSGLVALATSLNLLSKWSIDQSQKVGAMVNAGVRYLDLRFTCWSNNAFVDTLDTSDFSDYKAVHSDRTFDVNGVQVVQELVNSLSLSDKEVVFIKLKYETLKYGAARGVTGDYTAELVKLFHQEVISQYGSSSKPFISPSVGPGSSLEAAIKDGGRIVLLAPETAGISDVWLNDEYWRNMVEWPDGTTDTIIDSASEWWNYVQNNVNLEDTEPPLLAGAFQYMSMTQTNGHKGGGAYNSVEETAAAINGDMANWLVNASPIDPSPQSPDGKALPYLSEEGKGAPYYENYNIVAMDFYEKCPLVADVILANLMVAWRSYYR